MCSRAPWFGSTAVAGVLSVGCALDLTGLVIACLRSGACCLPPGWFSPVRLFCTASHNSLPMLLAIPDPQGMVPLPPAAAGSGLELLLTNLWVGKGNLHSLWLSLERKWSACVYVLWVRALFSGYVLRSSVPPRLVLALAAVYMYGAR